MRLTEQDMQMRREGYVTAAEVAEAVSRDLSRVHRGIAEGRYPGKSVGSETYKRHYVDVHALIAGGSFAGSATITAKLEALAALVPKPAAQTPAAKRPDAVSSLVAKRRTRARSAAGR